MGVFNFVEGCAVQIVVLEIPHCVRNDDATLGAGGEGSGGFAAASFAPLFFHKRLSFRTQ